MSHPFFGQEFSFTQPDGTQLRVRGWGNQHRARFETLDGFTVIKNPSSGFYEFATTSPDGERLVPTGAKPGSDDPTTLGLAASLRASREVVLTEAETAGGLRKPRWQTRVEERKLAQRSVSRALLNEEIVAAPPGRHTIGDYVGLCLLIQFPDVAPSVNENQVHDYCNQVGYNGFGNNGSVHDYFFDVSNGKLRYTTVVAPFYTAQHPRSYYTDPSVPYGSRAADLVREALTFHRNNGFDFSRLTVDGSQVVYATNLFYAGPVVNNFREGLWPHASSISFNLGGGRFAGDYQVTALDNFPTLGTYCHENGHMLCDFPDLYDLGDESSGIGAYCLMCRGGLTTQLNPTHVCAYLKYRAGWANSVMRVSSGASYTAFAGSNEFFLHEKNPREYFIIENRQKTGRDTNLTDAGLAIWHVDETGNNSNEQMTPASHYECSLMQADGRHDLESGRFLIGDDTDLYPALNNSHFGDGTNPNSRWWDSSSSGLDVFNISPSSAAMTFSVNLGGTTGPQRLPLPVDVGAINPNGSFQVVLSNNTNISLRVKTVRFSNTEPQVFSIDLNPGNNSGPVTFLGGSVRGVAAWSLNNRNLIAARAVPIYQSTAIPMVLTPGLPVPGDIGETATGSSFTVRFRNASTRGLRMKTVRFPEIDPVVFSIDLGGGQSSSDVVFFGGSTRLLAIWSLADGKLIHLQPLPLYQSVLVTYRELVEMLGDGTQVTVPLVALENLV